MSILFLLPAFGSEQKRDSIIVSLITCWPGPEVYELCGHEAVRVRSAEVPPVGLIASPRIYPQGQAPLDSVWNYGTFDFTEPNFVYRFVKGETDYMLAGYPFRYFMPEYLAEGRRVVEQDLNLTQDEAWRLLGELREESRPENCRYRYNYVKDNCATRIVGRLESAVGSRVIFPDTVKYGTFRREMRHYHRDYPWYQFGIDLALGQGLDYDLTGREEMFVPLEMMEKAGGAHLEDGRPLVAATRTLTEGVPDATLGPTHWSATPLFCCSAFFVMVLLVCWLQARRRQIYRAVYSVWFLLLGLTGCVVAFLVFASSHEATSPNLLILWLNPLQLVAGVAVWFRRKGRWPVMVMMCYNVIVVGILLLVWPFQHQSANPSFFPLMGATVALAATYAIMRPRMSYNNNTHTYKSNTSTRDHEEVGNLGARRSGVTRRSGAGGSRPAKARGGNRR